MDSEEEKSYVKRLKSAEGPIFTEVCSPKEAFAVKVLFKLISSVAEVPFFSSTERESPFLTENIKGMLF